MTLSEKIKLIDDPIREKAEVTIKDYIEALEEIMQVEEGTEEAFMKERLREDRKIAFMNQNISRDNRGRFIRREHQKAAS